MQIIPEIWEAKNELMKKARKMFYNYEDAEDCVQETIIKAHLKYDLFKKGTNIKAWLYTMMKHLIISHYKRNAIIQRYQK